MLRRADSLREIPERVSLLFVTARNKNIEEVGWERFCRIGIVSSQLRRQFARLRSNQVLRLLPSQSLGSCLFDLADHLPEHRNVSLEELLIASG